MAQRSILIWVSIWRPSRARITGVTGSEARLEVALLVAGEETLREIAGRPNRRAVLCAKSLSQER
jgi:hypothetical protein